MALVPSTAAAAAAAAPLFAEVDMGGSSDPSSVTVRATVVQASTVFYDPPATLGIEIYCAPTADARDVWQASMTHIALEGGCFVLSANLLCRRKDCPPPADYVFAGADDEPSPDSVVCPGGSVIISPSGAVLAGPNYEGEALISADLDIARAKFDFDVVGHHSRPEVLSLTVKDHPQNSVSFTSAVMAESL